MEDIKLGRLKSLGVESPWQVPLIIPNAYKDMSQIYNGFAPSQFYSGQTVVLKGTLVNQPEATWAKGSKVPKTQFIIKGIDGHTVSFVLFGDTRSICEALSKNPTPIYVFGSVDSYNGKMQIRDAEIVDDTLIGKIIGVYPGKAKSITPSTTHQKVKELLSQTIPLAEKSIKSKLAALGISNALLRRALNCPQWTLSEILIKIHYPESLFEAQQAQDVMERIEGLCIVSSLQNAGEKRCLYDVTRSPIKSLDIEPFLNAYKFNLTLEQISAFKKIVQALSGKHPYRFLLLGDVGSGKSAVMMSAASYVASSSERAVMLFPNQSLAIQMFADFEEAFPAISSQLVITDTDTKLDLRSFNVLIGTTALLHRDVGEFALCITDEEQKLSVNMKEQLVGKDAHMLIASATPIPRTTALAQHGGVEILKLTKCHAKKEFVTTISCAGDERAMTENAKSVIAAGGKVLIVCPKRVTEDADNKDELPSAETIGNKWKKLLPGLVRVAHSGLKNSENEQSINDVKTGEAKMLVATSVVEVGLNIPNLWMVIVVDAKRFGLSVIHQIRGRLIRQGENNGVGYCVLYCPGPIKEKTRERLNVLVNVQDGYEIAREDMFLRGLGDISDRGKSQHGSADAMCIGKEVSLVIIEEILGLFEEESNNMKVN